MKIITSSNFIKNFYQINTDNPINKEPEPKKQRFFDLKVPQEPEYQEEQKFEHQEEQKPLVNSILPPVGDIINKLQYLINNPNNINRKEITKWADMWLKKINENIDYEELTKHNIKDLYEDHNKVIKYLEWLSGADAISTDRPYLYELADFELWLKEIIEEL